MTTRLSMSEVSKSEEATSRQWPGHVLSSLREQLFTAAAAVVEAGATILRGDAFKPRTSPYSFQGLGEKGLELMAEARDEFGTPFIAEVLDPRDVDLVCGYADLIRVGTRNMANFTLLSELGKQPKPVMLKRGLTATIEEWAERRRIHLQRRKPQRDPVRTWDSNL